jgi:hypothetical protein
MNPARPAAVGIALAAALFTLACMLVGMRAAGPVTWDYNLGSLELEVRPSFAGKAQLYLPLAGWQLEAPIFSAPYAIRVEPRRVSVAAITRASNGLHRTIKRTQTDLKDAAIWTFVRAFLFALAGGLAAGAVVTLTMRALQRRWGAAVRAGGACLALAALVLVGSGLWLWQSLDIDALKRARVTSGHGKALTTVQRELALDEGQPGFLQDLATLVARARRIDLTSGS